MRTPEEWVKCIFDGANLTESTRFDFDKPHLEDLIDAVQTNAFNDAFAQGKISGLREAWKIIRTRVIEIKTKDYNCAVEECQIFVMAE